MLLREDDGQADNAWPFFFGFRSWVATAGKAVEVEVRS